MSKNYIQRLTQSAHRALALRTARRVERGLAHFERRHPQDDRPRQAIAAARAWAHGELTMTAARTAAFAAHARHAAAYAAKSEAAACDQKIPIVTGKTRIKKSRGDRAEE
jgi:hypothetical protein